MIIPASKGEFLLQKQIMTAYLYLQRGFGPSMDWRRHGPQGKHCQRNNHYHHHGHDSMILWRTLEDRSQMRTMTKRMFEAGSVSLLETQQCGCMNSTEHRTSVGVSKRFLSSVICPVNSEPKTTTDERH